MTDAPELLKRTVSRCPSCQVQASAEVWRVGNEVQLTRVCPTHGAATATISSDARFYWLAQGNPENAGCCGGGGCCGDDEEDEAVEEPLTARRASDGGVAGTLGRNALAVGGDAPFETLSTCLALIEIVHSCNLACPTCYADSPQHPGSAVDEVPLADIQARVQGVIDRKGPIEILQLSGGEPTLHGQFFELLDWARAHPDIGYVLLNTNGVRIARDDDFLTQLGQTRAGHLAGLPPVGRSPGRGPTDAARGGPEGVARAGHHADGRPAPARDAGDDRHAGQPAARLGLAFLLAEGWTWRTWPTPWLGLLTGKSVLGALPGGYAGVEFAKARLGYREWTGDRFAALAPAGIALGRVGCLFQGCCPGVRCAAPGAWWTLTDAAGVPRWPAVPVELGFNVLALAVFWVLRRKRLFVGQHFHLYLIGYGPFRFVHEFARDTPRFLPAENGAFGLTGYQLIALAVAGFGLWAFAQRAKSGHLRGISPDGFPIR